MTEREAIVNLVEAVDHEIAVKGEPPTEVLRKALNDAILVLLHLPQEAAR